MKDGVFWPRDLLARDVPHARIMTVSGVPLCLALIYGLQLIIYAYSGVTMRKLFRSLIRLAVGASLIIVAS